MRPPSNAVFQKSKSCRLVALCMLSAVRKAACKPSAVALCSGELGVRPVLIVGVMSWTSSVSPRQEGGGLEASVLLHTGVALANLSR